jgi:hypothetical protein
MITGRVCLLTDLRQIGVAAECADTGAGHWTVSLGSHTAISGDNGAFSIEAPLGGGFTWHVTAGRIVTSAMPFGADNTIPVLLADRYTELLTENQASLSDLQGSIVVRVVRSNQPVPDVVATALSDATMDSLYDANSAEIWGPNSTGTRGLAWLPSVTVPTPARQVPVTLSLLGTVVATTPVTVENQTVTFVTQELPPLP